MTDDTSTGPEALRAVDLFCGAGGLSLGLENAGIRTAFALDHDRHACETFRSNLGGAVRCGPLSDYPPERILAESGLDVGDAFVVCGGPPCQGFSVQRRGPMEDDRNSLVGEFARVAVALAPKFVLMENVPTLLGARGREHVESFVEIVTRAGYDHAATVLTASEYGVPQNRRRAFVVAWDRERVSGFAFPPPTGPVRTVRDAIADLPPPPADYTDHPDFPNHKRVKMSAVNLERISHVPEGGGRLDVPEHLQLPCHRNAGGHRHLDVYGRMTWDEPAPTITAMFDNFTRGRFAHPEQDRSVTGREGARLQSFPDDFVFEGPKKEVARQIGNAVPPLLAEHLGRALRAAAEAAADRPFPEADGQYRLAV